MAGFSKIFLKFFFAKVKFFFVPISIKKFSYLIPLISFLFINFSKTSFSKDEIPLGKYLNIFLFKKYIPPLKYLLLLSKKRLFFLSQSKYVSLVLVL